MLAALAKAGFKAVTPKATFYVWVENPKGFDSASFASRVLEETAVVITPGTGFGPSGEGYVRFSLTVADDRLAEAVARIERLSL